MTAEARMPTDRAGRYLVQLCRHLDQIGRQHGHRAEIHAGAPPDLQRVEYTDHHGVISFAFGQCTLDATPDALLLRVEANDHDSLRRIQDQLAHRIQSIGRRDKVTVVW